MFVVVVEFEIHPDFHDAFRDRVRRQAADSLTLEADCHQFDVTVATDDPGRVLLYEIYSDRDAFDAHLASAHFIQFDAEVSDWVKTKTVAFYHRI